MDLRIYIFENMCRSGSSDVLVSFDANNPVGSLQMWKYLPLPKVWELCEIVYQQLLRKTVIHVQFYNYFLSAFITVEFGTNVKYTSD